MLFTKISDFGKNYPSALRKGIGFAVSIFKFLSSSCVRRSFNSHLLITTAVVHAFQRLLTCGSSAVSCH